MRCKVCGKEHSGISSPLCSVWCQGVAWREAEDKGEILPVEPPTQRRVKAKRVCPHCGGDCGQC